MATDEQGTRMSERRIHTARPPAGDRRGFTLIELLVTIAILGVLMGLMVPVVGSVRAEARSAECLSNLRQIWAGLEQHRMNRDHLLPNTEPLPAPTPDGPVGGLPETLEDTIPKDSGVWTSPADFSADVEELGTSYVYTPGAFMMIQPYLPELDIEQNERRIARVVTNGYDGGIYRRIPVLADNEPRHFHGSRLPRNVVMYTGEARPMQPEDGTIPDASSPANPGTDPADAGN